MYKQLLLVEDDPTITDFMKVVFSKEHYQLKVAKTGMEALTLVQMETFDLLLLDLGLPDIDGIELLKIFRKRMTIPIIVVSARTNEVEKVKALDCGADDYVTKPFGTNELLARIRTSLRHAGNQQAIASPIIENKHLKIDLDKQLFYKKGKEVHLTKNEYRILTVLFQQLGKVVTYDTLMTAVWGPYSGDSQILRVNMSNIRKKIEENTLEPEYLTTEIGVGYRMKDYREN